MKENQRKLWASIYSIFHGFPRYFPKYFVLSYFQHFIGSSCHTPNPTMVACYFLRSRKFAKLWVVFEIYGYFLGVSTIAKNPENKIASELKPFLANVPILYSLKTPENLWGFLCFQGV